MISKSRLILILIIEIHISLAWDLSEINIPSDYYLANVAVSKNRAFLCLPRLNNRTTATLVEVTWLGDVNPFGIRPKVKIYPSEDAQNPDDCSRIQSCRALDIDTKGRLWVLDVPHDRRCQPKILVYSMFMNNEVQNCDLTDLERKNLNTVAADPVVNVWGARAYVSDPGDGQIVVYSLKERRWWRVQLIRKENGFVDGVSFVMSKKDPIAYVYSANNEQMYSMSLNELRRSAGPLPVLGTNATVNAEIVSIGNTLGPASGFAVDMRGFMYYFLTRDFAVVRIDTKKELIAENHDILFQSADVLPHVSQLLIVGPQFDVWAVVNAFDVNTNQSSRRSNADLQQRCMKITKSNFIF